MKLQACVISIMAVLVGMIGCDRGVSKPVPVVTKPVLYSRSYPLLGVVKKLDRETGEVTIAHEELVGFMPKMTMPFLVRNKGLLNGIQAGDQIEGTLVVDSEGAEVKKLDLTALKVVGHESKVPEDIGTSATTQAEVLKPGEPVPDFAMTTQDGKTLKLADLRGKVVVLSFIYTRCPSPEYCPAMDAKFADLARRIGTIANRAENVRLLSVSFDPEHDTPEVLKAHADRRGAKPPLWTFAVASHQELSKVAGPLGLTYLPGTREIDHNLRAAVIGPDGRLARVEVGPGWTPADLIPSIYELIPVDRK